MAKEKLCVYSLCPQENPERGKEEGREVEPEEEMKKKQSLSSLENKLDRIFSEYIRRKDADEGGTVQCVTCRKLLHWKDAHAGHFVKRQHRATRWDERNVAVQCPRDNVFRGGCQDEFALHIIHTYGEPVFADLMTKKHRVTKFTRADLEEMIEKYKQKLGSLNGRTQD